MTERDSLFLKKWEKHREKGKWKNILTTVLVFTVVFPLTILLLDYFFWKDEEAYNLEFFGRQVFIGVVAGFFSGFYSWYFNEKKYHRLKGTKSSE
ncbi:MAG: hypothetical protein N4A46_16215 [Schleiferiaceae bacterium]|jgi:hypothetical protein|nr:hypothetical protein [Schleiferiaceae bacterium]